jgi:hypothetical protein
VVKRDDKSDALVDEEGDESFPASDPPASNAGSRVGGPRRADFRENDKSERPRKPSK